jgi:hypothetical protein
MVLHIAQAALAASERASFAILHWFGLNLAPRFTNLQAQLKHLYCGRDVTEYRECLWMRQIACNATLEGMGHLNGCRYVLHDRDAKFCAEFRETLAAGGA